MLNNVRLAISGKSGCGNSTLSKLLAEKLNVRLINYTFHSIAAELSMDFEEFCKLAEKDSKWDRMVDEKQVAMANEGPCVLGSRLAIWIWKEAEFRVYLDAPLLVRAKRIQKREGGELEVVAEQTRKRDMRDHERYLKLYGIDNDVFEKADLILDVGELTPEQAAKKIIEEYSLLKDLKNSDA